jgi:1-acyl-sn-glycerol-3-phosphate acyltransferase
MPTRLADSIHRDWQPAQRGFLARVCRGLLHAAGWRLTLDIPRIERAVIVFYPHTSNWDFVIGLVARFALAVPVTWAGKDGIFRGPFSPLWRRLGGIPVNRREATGFVGQMIDAFARRPMLLAIAPEGTRRRTDHWKSGFYRVALGAHVPLALAFIDFARREIGVGAMLEPTGDADADLARMRAFYSEKTARHPDQASPIALKRDPAMRAADARAAPASSPLLR